jgi:uncharacterized membrane protein YgdD (TMEM256/DUF423 family)
MMPLLIFLGGMSGALGVSLSAVAAHYPGGSNLALAAQMLLAHGPVFLALAALARTKALPGWVLGLTTALLALGLVLFAGDIARRVFQGTRLFPWAAPLGGSTMIAAWLWLMLVGFFSLFRHTKAD